MTAVDVEARKWAALQELLADGWRPADLTWYPPVPLPAETQPSTTRIVQVFDASSRSFTPKTETLTQEQAERDAAKRREYEVRRSQGMWAIKGESVYRRQRENVARIIATAHAGLSTRWPNEAAIVREAMTTYAARYDLELPVGIALRQIVRIKRMAELLPSDGAAVVRLMMEEYFGKGATERMMDEGGV